MPVNPLWKKGGPKRHQDRRPCNRGNRTISFPTKMQIRGPILLGICCRHPNQGRKCSLTARRSKHTSHGPYQTRNRIPHLKEEDTHKSSSPGSKKVVKHFILARFWLDKFRWSFDILRSIDPAYLDARKITFFLHLCTCSPQYFLSTSWRCPSKRLTYAIPFPRIRFMDIAPL